MPDVEGSVLLDTHVWIWLMEGDREQLAPAALEAVREASLQGEILVSAISVWEVAMLEARGRLRLSRSIDDWVHRALRAPGTHLLRLTPEIAIESTRLPDDPPGDPADRILVAGARRTGARLATRDTELIGYAEAGHLAIVDAGP